MTLIENIEKLKSSYVDTCTMCTKCSCSECLMTSIIDDLSELLREAKESER